MALQTSFDDVMWNLKILSSIDNNQTLYTKGDKLYFDNRMCQFLRRYFDGDSRTKIQNVIDKTLKVLNEIITSYKLVLQKEQNGTQLCNLSDTVETNIQEFLNIYDQVNKGLETLSTFERYNSDMEFKISTETYKKKIINMVKNCKEIVKS